MPARELRPERLEYQDKVFLGLGSNVGDREAMLRRAVACLGEIPQTTVTRCSSVYETEPWGAAEQPAFLNLVAEVRTGLSPHRLLRACQAIEARLGRERGERWGPRAIDVDLLLWEEVILGEEEIVIPHPAMEGRRFVLVPLAELAPEVREPVRGRTITDLLASCLDRGEVRRHGPFLDPAPRARPPDSPPRAHGRAPGRSQKGSP